MAWLAVFFLMGFGVWSLQGGHLMIIIYLVLGALVYGVYAFRVRCRRCGVPILLRPVSLCGIRFYLWSLAAPEYCRHCGERL